jgi:hypothetical protein
MIKRIVIEVEEALHKKIKYKALKEEKSMRLVVLELLTEWLKK